MQLNQTFSVNNVSNHLSLSSSLSSSMLLFLLSRLSLEISRCTFNNNSQTNCPDVAKLRGQCAGEDNSELTELIEHLFDTEQVGSAVT